MNWQKLTRISQGLIFNEVEDIFESSEISGLAFEYTNVDDSKNAQNSQNVTRKMKMAWKMTRNMTRTMTWE